MADPTTTAPANQPSSQIAGASLAEIMSNLPAPVTSLVYTGQGAVGIDDYKKQWFSLPDYEKQRWISLFQEAGYKVNNEFDAFSVWTSYGEKSSSYYEFGGNATPETLVSLDIASKSATGTTGGMGEAGVISQYGSQLGRLPTAGELSTGVGAGPMEFAKQITGSEEYQSEVSAGVLDSMYAELSRRASAVRA